ncbi:MAG: Integrin alpha beta-propellor repeat protein [Labilithrix sp.]|nr:Integrin alpha beta-propellor repeat protein [Labilithrix sp.]
MSTRALTRFLGLLALLSLIVSCGVAVSFDDYGTIAHRRDAGFASDDDAMTVPAPSTDGGADVERGTDSSSPIAPFDAAETAPPILYGVRGVVSGLDGLLVTIGVEVNQPLKVGDGPFTLPPALLDGASFVLTVLAQPQGRVCYVEHASGVISGADAVGVEVNCQPAVAQLISVCIPTSEPLPCPATNRPLVPAFTPEIYEYSIVFPSSVFAFSVSAKAVQLGSKVTISGPAPPGVANGYFYPSVGPNLLTIDVTAPDGFTHAAYHITVFIDPTHYVKASNGRTGASFGAAVALDGDTLVVGAPGESSNAVGVGGGQDDTSQPGAGAVYVFTRSIGPTGMVWSQTAYLKASNTAAGARFGSAVALAGSTLVVASEAESSGAGAVYVFDRVAGLWSQTAYLKASNASADARFGTSIALSMNTLAVGAPGEASAATGLNGDQTSVAAPSAGAAYVFTRTGGAWSQEAYVKASNARAGARFGAAVALQGDRLVVGAPGDSSASTGINGNQSAGGTVGAGAAYTLARFGTTWSHELFAKEELAPAHVDGAFGSSVAIAQAAVIVGWPAIDAVATFVFSPGFGWGANSTYPVPHAASGHPPPVLVTALDYPMNYLLLIGSPFESSGGVVQLAGAQPPPTNLAKPGVGSAVVHATNPRPDARFGAAMAFAGSTLAVGSPGESSGATTVDGNQADTSAPSAGAVYVY